MNIFLLHRDLRFTDNLGLAQLVADTPNEKIALFFIFNKKQNQENNRYFSATAFNYLLHALHQLDKQVTINFFESDSELEVFSEVLKTNKIKRIYTNKDWTNFALKRDAALAEFSNNNSIKFKSFNDYLLFRPSQIKPINDNFYKVFTPFWNNVKKLLVKVPEPLGEIIFQSQRVFNKFSIDLNTKKITPLHFSVPLSFEEVKNVISHLDMDYATSRNNLTLEAKPISPAIKFGIVSIRQALYWGYQRFHTYENTFIKQLIWREFFYHFSYLAQKNHKWIFGQNWNRKFDQFAYDNNKSHFIAWKNGETGIQIIDAAMQQLNTTGYMHNRTRMLCASFLVKNLLVDWRWGELYFAQKLIDYDPIVNQMSWQWAAGCGVDAQPFVRIFNPELQSQKFDPQQIYVKRYLKRNIEIKPIIDLKSSAHQAKIIFAKLK